MVRQLSEISESSSPVCSTLRGRGYADVYIFSLRYNMKHDHVLLLAPLYMLPKVFTLFATPRMADPSRPSIGVLYPHSAMLIWGPRAAWSFLPIKSGSYPPDMEERLTTLSVTSLPVPLWTCIATRHEMEHK